MVVGCDRVEPSSPCFIIDAAAPSPGRRIDLYLVAVNELPAGIVAAVAAYLDARIEECVNLDLELENEVRIFLSSTHKAVWGIRGGNTHHHAVFNNELCLAASLNKSGKIGAVEQIMPV